VMSGCCRQPVRSRRRDRTTTRIDYCLCGAMMHDIERRRIVALSWIKRGGQCVEG
jgi:hypothetical protein